MTKRPLTGLCATMVGAKRASASPGLKEEKQVLRHMVLHIPHISQSFLTRVMVFGGASRLSLEPLESWSFSVPVRLCLAGTADENLTEDAHFTSALEAADSL